MGGLWVQETGGGERCGGVPSECCTLFGIDTVTVGFLGNQCTYLPIYSHDIQNQILHCYTYPLCGTTAVVNVVKHMFILSTCVQLHIHRASNQVQHMYHTVHSSSSGSPLLSREASAAISSRLSVALSDLWLTMFGAGALYSMDSCAYSQLQRDTHALVKPTAPVRLL